MFSPLARPRLREIGGPALLAFGGLALLIHAVRLHVVGIRTLLYLHYNDFGKFYYSLQQWRENGTLYGPSPATLLPFGNGRTEQLWNMNPPHFHALIWPLAYLPVEDAYAVWTAANVSVAGITLVAIRRALRLRWGLATWMAGLIGAFASAPVLTWVATGQLTGLVFGVVTAVWLSARRDQWKTSGLLIGLLCSVKPFLGLLWVYLLIRQQWRAATLAAGAAIAAFAVGLAVFGLQAHRDWLLAISDAQWIGSVMNASVYGLVGRTWSLDVFTPAPSAYFIASVMAMVIVLSAIAAIWRTSDPDRAILIVLATSLLASPLGWVYYTPIMLGPIIALKQSGRLRLPLYPALLGFMVPNLWLWPYTSRWFAVTIGSAYTWSLLCVWSLALLPAPAASLERERIHGPREA
jgi:hypothetical protein